MSDSNMDIYGHDSDERMQTTDMADQNRRINALLSVLNTIEFDCDALMSNLDEYHKDRQNNWDSRVNTQADAFWTSESSDSYMKAFGMTGDKAVLREQSICDSIHHSLYVEEITEDARQLREARDNLRTGSYGEIHQRVENLCGALAIVEEGLPELEEYYTNARLAHAGYEAADIRSVDIVPTECDCREQVGMVPRLIKDIRREIYYYQNVDQSILQA